MRLPLTIRLMSSRDKLKCKRVKSVLRYHVPNQHNHPEKYAHHMLFMFYPFRNESDLCAGESGTYMKTLCDPAVIDIVNENKLKFEPFAELVDAALTDYRTDLTRNPDSFSQQENDEVSNMLDPETEQPEEEEVPLFEDLGQPLIDLPTLMPDSEVNSKISSLKTKQREIFEVINKWAPDYVKYSSCLLKESISPLHLFISGSGGCGKSHLIKTVYNSLSKTLTSKKSDKPTVLLVKILQF